MKHNSFLIALLILAAPSISCSILNAVRHQVNPPNVSSSNSNTNQPPPAALNAKDIENLKAKAQELANTSAPVKLDSKAKVRSKVLIIDKSESGTIGVKGFSYTGDDYFQPDLDTYNLKKEDLAVKAEEIKTVILKTCEKGKQIGRYSLTDGRKIPAYALNCKVSMIDYQVPAIFAEKKFSSTNLAETINATKYTVEETAVEPYTDISDYIKNFPRQ